MKKKAAFRFQGNQKEFMNIFHELCYSRQPWEVWSDVVTMMACSIANAAGRTEGRHEKREKEYAECLKRVGSVEKPAQLFAAVVNALEEDPEQDFLGQMYMGLNLGSHWKGQFFTPYNVCRMMAEMNFGDGAKAEAESQRIFIRLRSMRWRWGNADSRGKHYETGGHQLPDKRHICRAGR